MTLGHQQELQILATHLRTTKMLQNGCDAYRLYSNVSSVTVPISGEEPMTIQLDKVVKGDMQVVVGGMYDT